MDIALTFATYFLLSAFAIWVIRTATIGVCMDIVASRNGTMFYDKASKQWAAWFGTRTVSSKVDVTTVTGSNPIVFLFYLLKAK